MFCLYMLWQQLHVVNIDISFLMHITYAAIGEDTLVQQRSLYLGQYSSYLVNILNLSSL